MTPGWNKARCLTAVALGCLFGAAVVHSQAGSGAAPTGERPLLAEEAFKNIQVLRGIPAKEFMQTMGFFSAALALNCADCHGEDSGSDWANYAKDTPRKQTARRMVRMVNTINESNFGGRRMVTCYTCHNGSQRPKATPSLAVQYGEPPPDDPDELEKVPGARVTVTADQILDKYTQALGGADALSRMSSFTAMGTYEGFDSDFMQVPVNIYAKAPDMRTMVVHMKGGDSTSTFNGREAWASGPATLVPITVLPLMGGELEGARLDAYLSFPGQIKQQLNGWTAGFPALRLDNQPVDVIEARTPGGARVKLYFDRNTSLLVRQVRYADTAVGTVTTHVIYSDYRTVSGIKMPFEWQTTWVDGQFTVKLNSVQTNAPVEATRFTKAVPPR